MEVWWYKGGVIPNRVSMFYRHGLHVPETDRDVFSFMRIIRKVFPPALTALGASPERLNTTSIIGERLTWERSRVAPLSVLRKQGKAYRYLGDSSGIEYIGSSDVFEAAQNLCRLRTHHEAFLRSLNRSCEEESVGFFTYGEAPPHSLETPWGRKFVAAGITFFIPSNIFLWTFLLLSHGITPDLEEATAFVAPEEGDVSCKDTILDPGRPLALSPTGIFYLVRRTSPRGRQGYEVAHITMHLGNTEEGAMAPHSGDNERYCGSLQTSQAYRNSLSELTQEGPVAAQGLRPIFRDPEKEDYYYLNPTGFHDDTLRLTNQREAFPSFEEIEEQSDLQDNRKTLMTEPSTEDSVYNFELRDQVYGPVHEHRSRLLDALDKPVSAINHFGDLEYATSRDTFLRINNRFIYYDGHRYQYLSLKCERYRDKSDKTDLLKITKRPKYITDGYVVLWNKIYSVTTADLLRGRVNLANRVITDDEDDYNTGESDHDDAVASDEQSGLSDDAWARLSREADEVISSQESAVPDSQDT